MHKFRLALTATVFLFAESATCQFEGAHEGNTLFGPQVPLSESFRFECEKGDYVAAGVGMRNLGNGIIDISLPQGSCINTALLYWAIIRVPGPPAPNTAMLNGVPILGTLIGTSGSPCWTLIEPDALIDVYRADVTGIATDGVNVLTDFPSGLAGTPGLAPPPQMNIGAFPLLEGATLVVVYESPTSDFHTVVIRDGAQTFCCQGVITRFGPFAPVVFPVSAKTTYIVGDGQARFDGDIAIFRGTFAPGTGFLFVAGWPGSPKPTDAFDGNDGLVSVHPLDGLWDTLTGDVSSAFGVDNGAIVVSRGSRGRDCLTWCAQVYSVKSHRMAHLDVKPQSCPNPLNVQSRGLIPATIVGTSSFDVTTVDPASITLEGVSPLRFDVEDVATPFTPTAAACVPNCVDCTDRGADGFPDLSFKFDKGALVDALGAVEDGDCLFLNIEGRLLDGTPIKGRDVVLIQNRE